LSDLTARVPANRLEQVVRTALGAPRAQLGSWTATPLRGGFSALAGHTGVDLLEGVARVDAEERPWTLVLKTVAPVAAQDDQTQIRYWKREFLLYSSGVLADLPPGVRAPRCYGWDELPDGGVRLWLEHVVEEAPRDWSIERWALVARHLGRMNGAYLAGRPLPQAPWLGGGRLRTWLGFHGPMVERIAGALDNPAVRHYWKQPTVDAILRVWADRETYLTALDRLPQTFGHGDAIRRNLLVSRGAGGALETVGVDWEYAGHYAPGEDVGQTLSVAPAFYHLEPDELPRLDEALYPSYLAGLRDAGCAVDEPAVRFAYTAHAALRNLFNAVAANAPPDDARRAAIVQSQGRTWEELAERRVAMRPFLLARADEARSLLEAL
jgi:hypothetical protein